MNIQQVGHLLQVVDVRSAYADGLDGHPDGARGDRLRQRRRLLVPQVIDAVQHSRSVGERRLNVLAGVAGQRQGAARRTRSTPPIKAVKAGLDADSSMQVARAARWIKASDRCFRVAHRVREQLTCSREGRGWRPAVQDYRTRPMRWPPAGSGAAPAEQRHAELPWSLPAGAD